MKFLFTLSLLLASTFTIAQSPAYNIVLQLKDMVIDGMRITMQNNNEQVLGRSGTEEKI